MSVENLKKLALMCEKDPKVRKRFAAIGLKDMDGLIKYGKELHLEFTRKDVEALANEFGGVRKGQTLYCISISSPLIIAMLWPWQDGERVTLKIAKG